MYRPCAIAICGAALATTLSSTAAAEVTLVERVRVQGGFIAEQRPAPFERINNWHLGILPDIVLTSRTARSEVSVGYEFSGALHTVYPSQIAHSLFLNGRFELSPQTTLLTNAFVTKTTMTNLLLTTPTTQSPTALLPTGTGTDLVMSTVGQALSHELSPFVRVGQRASATFFTALEPAPPIDSFGGQFGASLERVWERDAFGPEASVGYSIVRAAPPFRNQDFVLADGGPRWRRDWSRTISTTVAGGAAGLVSANGSSDTVVAPFARASFLYNIEPGLGWSVTASTGVTPNPLTGQAIQAHQGAFQAFTPISEPARLYGAATIGYLRGTLVDLSGRGDQSFHSANANVELIWRPTERIEVFGRYTFLAQIMDDMRSSTLPSFLRDSIFVGVGLSSHPRDLVDGRGRGRAGIGEAAEFGQRVDRGDAPGVRDEDGTDALQEGRERPPAGVGGTRWNRTSPAGPGDDEDEQPDRLAPRPSVPSPPSEPRAPGNGPRRR
ncbi:MAG: hypothetical protein BGO98_24830 [Myxococcales bacterium 68-20]|nr:MAG: hypothetical protein BGO98_24830 [Myxococcales bacterium 68-20]